MFSLINKKNFVNKILKDHIDEIIVLCQNYAVKSLYAIGDICKDNFEDDQEIDFLIDFVDKNKEQLTDRLYQMAFLFEKVLQHKVEVISWENAEYMSLVNEDNPLKELLYQQL